ncbi:uncharacterized protein LOC118460248 [Anopheles albimanus]|uniref:Ionotropic glutamate receptor C-terminal domain-containing protein n=1 Tax=Anopheles albimanus TaxID=7167 RepID=A0A182FWE0_ANOAL|nr:uncharacterized protein LOC118460248 [Anopheles albimanus]
MQYMWKVFVVSVMVLVYSDVSSSLASLDALHHRDCHSTAIAMETQILENYLADQRGVTVIDANVDIPIVSPFCLRNPMVLLKTFTLHHFQQFVKRSEQQIKDQFDYPTNECFIGTGLMEELALQLVPYLSRYNPRAKILLITYEMPDAELVQLFHDAWYRYRLLQLVVLNHRDNNTIDSCVFNPFTKAAYARGSIEFEQPTVRSDLDCTLLTHELEVLPYGWHLKEFVRNRVRNLHGYPVRIAMHVSNGSSSAYDCILGAVSFTDIDQEVLSTLENKMNFSMVLHNNELELSIGYIHKNGTPVGALGLIEHNQIDLAANSRIMYKYDTRNLLYLNYISTEKLVFLTPRNYYSNRDKMLVFINPFSVAYMLINVLLSFGVPMIICLSDYLYYRNALPRNTRKPTYGTKVMSLLGIIYNVSVRLPRAPHKRWIIVGILLYNIVSYPIWQAVTIRYLHPSNQLVNNINSLEQLLSTELKLKVSHYHELIVRHEGSQLQNPLYAQLSDRLTTENTSSLRDAIENIIIAQDSALLISDAYVPLVLADNYKWVPGKPDAIWPIAKPIYEFYKSMAVPKMSPFIDTFNAIVVTCLEAGMNDRFMHQLESVVQLMKMRRTKEYPNEPDNYIVFTMAHLSPLFLFYLSMLALSGCIFVLELVVHRIQTARARSGPTTATVEAEYVPFEFVL